jgi:NTE family protein
MARALLEAGHFPDMLYGTSAGALNAAALAADPSLRGVTALEDLWRAVRRQDVFPVQPLQLAAGLVGAADHLVSSTRLRRWLARTTPVPRLQDAAVPLTVVTTDIQSGEEILLSSGPTVPALLASAAMPGIFPPVSLGGRLLMDGSIVSDTPIGPAVRAGAEVVFVLPCVPEGRSAPPRTALDAVLRSTAVTLARHHERTVATWAGRCRLHVLPAPAVPGSSAFSFTRTAELVEAAHRLTTEWLATGPPVVAPPPPLPQGSARH